MKITIERAREAFAATKELVQERMAGKTAMGVRKFARELEPIVADSEQERMKILSDYAQLDGNGKVVFAGTHAVFDDKAANDAFNEALALFYATEVEVSTTLKGSELALIELRPILLLQLGELIDDEG